MTEQALVVSWFSSPDRMSSQEISIFSQQVNAAVIQSCCEVVDVVFPSPALSLCVIFRGNRG